MRHLFLSLVAVIVAATVVVAGCSPAAPAAAPTAAPAKAGEPTKAAAAPAAAFPQKGKAIQWIVPFSAGGSTDIQARILADFMTKDLGTPVEVIDKPGAGSQLGLQELVTAKPDGYTIGNTNNATTMGVYLMPDRKANFNMSSFAPIGMFVFDTEMITVKADGPYKTYKDLIDAAKAKPKTVKVTTNGIFSDDHIAVATVSKAAGVQFAVVHFDGSADEVTALLGNKTDAAFMGVGASLPQVKAGTMRSLAAMDDQPLPDLPDVPTLKSLGINYIAGSARGISAPAGTPKEIVSVFEASLLRAMKDPTTLKKIQDMGTPVRVLNSAEYATFWANMEKDVKPAIELMLADQGIPVATAFPTTPTPAAPTK